MASQAFNYGITKIQDRTIDYANDTIKAMLMQNTYTHNPDNDFVSQISADEATGGTYARQTLAGKTINEDDANNRCWLDADNITSFGTVPVGQTLTGVVIFKDTGVAATSQLICFNEFSSSVVTNGGTVGANFNATGVLRFQI